MSPMLRDMQCTVTCRRKDARPDVVRRGPFVLCTDYLSRTLVTRTAGNNERGHVWCLVRHISESGPSVHTCPALRGSTHLRIQRLYIYH
jgi:hypothetical protein